MKTISHYRSGKGKGWGAGKGKVRGLSQAQKQAVVITARRAFDCQQKAGVIEDGVTFDGWRAEVSQRVCGRRISEATNRDFEGLMAEFSRLAGETRAAFHFASKDSDEVRDRQQVLAVLFRVLEALPAPAAQRGYANKICADQYKTGLEGATVAQLQGVVMTCRTRMRALAKAAPAAAVEDDQIPY